MTVTATMYRNGVAVDEPVAVDALAPAVGTDGAFVWVDAVAATTAELAVVGDQLALHPLAVEDALHARQRPKIEQYDHFLFLTVYGMQERSPQVEPGGGCEINLFVTPAFAVTVRHEPAYDFDELRRRLDRAPEQLAVGGAFFTYALLDEIIDGYLSALDRLHLRIEELEDSLVYHAAQVEGLQAAFTVRRAVIYSRRAVSPLREVLSVLARRDQSVLQHDLDAYYRDLYDHVVRINEELETALDLIAAALEAHLSVVSNRMNETVLKVSAWAAIFALPTVIASIYGMNFEQMPELRWDLGYPYALALMLSSAVGLYALFRHKRWL
jgi:magnesium transporter